MELINWPRNRIKKTLSPSFPDWTFYAGYAMHAWNKWSVLCLGIKYVFLSGTPIAVSLLIGSGVTLVYYEIWKLVAANNELKRLLENHVVEAGRDRRELHQKLTLIEEHLTRSGEKDKKLDDVLSQVSDLCRHSLDLNRKNEELEDFLSRFVKKH